MEKHCIQERRVLHLRFFKAGSPTLEVEISSVTLSFEAEKAGQGVVELKFNRNKFNLNPTSSTGKGAFQRKMRQIGSGSCKNALKREFRPRSDAQKGEPIPAALCFEGFSREQLKECKFHRF